MATGVKIQSAALAAALILLTACQGAPPPAGSAPPPELPAAGGPALPVESQPIPDPVLPGPVPEEEPPAEPQSQELPPEEEPEPEPPPNTTLYILMYHDLVQGDGQGLNNWMLTRDRFREDLEWLAGHGYTTVLPRELAAGEPLPERAVMLTFDDGYASSYQLAYPLLQEYGAKAAVALIVSLTDNGDPEYLSWDMCREMDQSGLVELGSHTYDLHRDSPRGVRRLPGESREEYEARVLPDLQRSIDLIEEQVGRPPGYFAYPYGQKDSWAAGFIAEHFSLTVITRHGSCDLSKGLYSLKRCNVSMGVPAGNILPD